MVGYWKVMKGYGRSWKVGKSWKVVESSHFGLYQLNVLYIRAERPLSWKKNASYLFYTRIGPDPEWGMQSPRPWWPARTRSLPDELTQWYLHAVSWKYNEELGIQSTTNSSSSTGLCMWGCTTSVCLMYIILALEIFSQSKACLVVSQKVHSSDGVLEHQFIWESTDPELPPLLRGSWQHIWPWRWALRLFSVSCYIKW